jgi:hypothetical protein
MRTAQYLCSILLMLGVTSCAKPDEKAEGLVLDCLRENNSMALGMLPGFEKFLIDSGYIEKWDKSNLQSLLKDLEAGRIEIVQSDFIPDEKLWEMETTFVSRFASWTACFTETPEIPTDNHHSVGRVAHAVNDIIRTNNWGPPNDQALIEAISPKDIKKDIYRVSAFYLIWAQARYVAERNEEE